MTTLRRRTLRTSQNTEAIRGVDCARTYDEQAPQAAEIDDYAMKEDIAHILARINAITTSPAMAGTPLAQMATLPPPSSPPPLIVGCPKPEGYLYVGAHHHGAPIWGSMDTMLLSRMCTNANAAAAGHAEGQ